MHASSLVPRFCATSDRVFPSVPHFGRAIPRIDFLHPRELSPRTNPTSGGRGPITGAVDVRRVRDVTTRLNIAMTCGRAGQQRVILGEDSLESSVEDPAPRGGGADLVGKLASARRPPKLWISGAVRAQAAAAASAFDPHSGRLQRLHRDGHGLHRRGVAGGQSRSLDSARPAGHEEGEHMEVARLRAAPVHFDFDLACAPSALWILLAPLGLRLPLTTFVGGASSCRASVPIVSVFRVSKAA